MGFVDASVYGLQLAPTISILDFTLFAVLAGLLLIFVRDIYEC